MPIVQSRKMSHIALNVTDVERQLAFYTEMAGFSLTAVDDRGNAYLRCNTQHHSVMQIPSSESGVDHIALSVGGAAELDAAASALARAGISHQLQPGQAMIYNAWEKHQFKGKGDMNSVNPSPMNPVEMAGGEGTHLKPWQANGQPSMFDRETRVEIERVEEAA